MTEKSPNLQKAKKLLSSVHKKPLRIEDRQEKAVELAALILTESNRVMTRKERKKQNELSKLMQDPFGKVFTTASTDQSFRSKKSARIASQFIYLLRVFGIPKFFSPWKKFQLFIFKLLGKPFAFILIPIMTALLRKETASVIIPGESRSLIRHIKKRRKQGVKLNINHLGEAILGEEEAKHRQKIYLDDLKNPLIDYVSVKISTIYSQINLLAWEDCLDDLAERLRPLYRAAMQNPIVGDDGKKISKFVNLDMEEYRDLHLTKDLFIKVLSEPEFHKLSAGIVLQAYLPDSFEIQREITEWAMKRVKKGGAPVKIRIVKGANLKMEQFEASLRGWEQAPYKHKVEADANYKHMLLYAAQKSHAKAVNIGIASHNIFDIAFGLILRRENNVEKELVFEMLEGMADHTRRVIQELSGSILLYCAVATREDFQSAIAYLIRRLDENTGDENFLAHSFGLTTHSEEWQEQIDFFYESCSLIKSVSKKPRRTQDRKKAPAHLKISDNFQNEPDTDFSLVQNAVWAEDILIKWEKKKLSDIPLVINGKTIHHKSKEGKGFDPSLPKKPAYYYTNATVDEVNTALKAAQKAQESWQKTPLLKRCKYLSDAANILRKKRKEFIGIMVKDGGKTLVEADVEYSEAIDFAEYYLRSIQELYQYPSVSWRPKGTVLVAPPWNFPISIPSGGVFAGLITGNTVIFKPAAEAVLCGWALVQVLWEAGVPKDVLQFITCKDDPVGSKLIKDPRVDVVILTGATSTANLFMQKRPGLDLSAETGGKNALIISALSDRDLAIKDLVQSAFGHNGQKCSAASLAILEKEVYDDPHFKKQLQDAVNSLHVGSAWDPVNKVTPLIHAPSGPLKRGLTRLEPGETWLVKPKPDKDNPNLWSPGVKWGVSEKSFTQTTELFGPVLGIIRAKNIDDAIRIANATPYGLTSGIHTLDDREQKKWRQKIVAGNCYINRTITGAIVQRQAFGGCKESSFGFGSKAGGPNYLIQLMQVEQIGTPKDRALLGKECRALSNFFKTLHPTDEEIDIWFSSLESYVYWKHKMRQKTDLSRIVGEDNFFCYVPRNPILLRIKHNDNPLDYLRSFAAAFLLQVPLEVSFDKQVGNKIKETSWKKILPKFRFIEETDNQLIQRIKKGDVKRIRMLQAPTKLLLTTAAKHNCYVNHHKVLALGRLELLHYVREASFSIDYHRYGNLGTREGEPRTPIL